MRTGVGGPMHGALQTRLRRTGTGRGQGMLGMSGIETVRSWGVRYTFEGTIRDTGNVREYFAR